MMDQKKLIVHFSRPPSMEDIGTIAEDALEYMPVELSDYLEDLELLIEDFPPEEMEEELELDSAYELLAYYKKHAEKIPGVQATDTTDAPSLTLYRRPILDLWCETEDELSALIRHVMISEIAQSYNYSEDEIDNLAAG